MYLGRPWRAWAKAVLLDCTLDAHIARAGFDDWGKTDAHDTVLFAEARSRGPGASDARAGFVRRLNGREADGITYADFWASMPG